MTRIKRMSTDFLFYLLFLIRIHPSNPFNPCSIFDSLSAALLTEEDDDGTAGQADFAQTQGVSSRKARRKSLTRQVLSQALQPLLALEGLEPRTLLSTLPTPLVTSHTVARDVRESDCCDIVGFITRKSPALRLAVEPSRSFTANPSHTSGGHCAPAFRYFSREY